MKQQKLEAISEHNAFKNTKFKYRNIKEDIAESEEQKSWNQNSLITRCR
jgi:hypothetical protein